MQPLPYLFICAFIANAASFVLPISNPANLVVYGAHMPTLMQWLAQFGWASLASIVVTFVMLRLSQRAGLSAIARDIQLPVLSRGGHLAAGGIVVTAGVLLIASSRDRQLGLPTFLAGLTTAAVILIFNRTSPWRIARDISWSILPLVAGLFVLAASVQETGVLQPVIGLLRHGAASAPDKTGVLSGTVAAIFCNLVNNLPLGLIAGTVVRGADLSAHVTSSILVGVDLGPNLSVTGSLATILWLVALRREGQIVSAWKFLALGCLVMPPALIASLAAVMLYR